MAQDIRLVCMSSDTEGAGCDHLFQAGGAEGKLVRLPEDVCSFSLSLLPCFPFRDLMKSSKHRLECEFVFVVWNESVCASCSVVCIG